jgi:cobalamin-dependent methionine synthase I
MYLIASNLSTRNAGVERIFRQAGAAGWKLGSAPARSLARLAEECAGAKPDALEINFQQHDDLPEAMTFAVNAVQQVTDKRLCLSTNNVETLEAGLRACRRPPIVNYLSVDEAKLGKMLPVIANHGAGVILLVSDPAHPADAREMLQKTALLVGAANEAGIANDDIFVDPGLIHVTHDLGQRHLVEIIEFLRALPDATEPAIKSTCWLANSSAGAARRLRPAIELTLLPLLVGAGLSSVFMDTGLRLNMRTARLIKIFNNDIVYSDAEAEL